MVYSKEIGFRTAKRSCWFDLTRQVAALAVSSGIENGLCVISSLHTTGGVTLNENADPDVELDFFYKLDKIFDRDPAFQHIEGNSDSHIKTSLVGLSATVPLRNSKLVLGTWQSIYFCEFDGPRNRQVNVTIIG
ncbi:MAG: secondary thiamine-phosphate synthase enzyme YjbQ [Chitinispirillales bacterium]|jgi:secondary thiamine-phosphate synthase enzyme|nr:secondary thiamine-phosphate synthase enzyme YjbQ [Chitinispirillales bacterium]